MGGMTLPIYVISSNVAGKPHHLSQAVLMSPAGFHSKGRVTPYMHYVGIFFYYLLPLVFDHIALPDCMIGLVQKLQQDLTSSPASRDLLNYCFALLMGGKAAGNDSVTRSARMVNSMIQFGFSTDLAKQFFQQYLYGRFQAFDFEQKEANMRVYGTEKPFSYQENYKTIDIPVHYYISLDDHLIRADDVLEHYNELKRHKPDLARVKVFKGFGHNDFTYGQHESMSLEL